MSKEIYKLILAVPSAASAFESADDQGVVTALNDKSVKHVDDTKRDVNWLMTQLSAQDSDTVLTTLQSATSAKVRAAYGAMLAGGIDLSHPLTQQMIPVVGSTAGWSTQLVDQILQAGIWFTSPAEDALGRPATLQDVADARQYRDLSLRVATNYNAAIEAIDLGNAQDWTTVTAILTQ